MPGTPARRCWSRTSALAIADAAIRLQALAGRRWPRQILALRGSRTVMLEAAAAARRLALQRQPIVPALLVAREHAGRQAQAQQHLARSGWAAPPPAPIARAGLARLYIGATVGTDPASSQLPGTAGTTAVISSAWPGTYARR
ncbi:MAG: hypothetical protein U0Z44_07485 [Kouleothrix sp.]